LLAKLIVWGPTRTAAIQRMQRALDELIIHGIATNQGFHRRLMQDAAFRRGEIDTQFLERRTDLLEARLTEAELVALAVGAALAEDELRHSRKPVVSAGADGASAWARAARIDQLV
ncbi:MAG: acetyl-CoA carboxylase biotin carboxylase subunit, partial [Gemmatimonadales bacterium]